MISDRFQGKPVNITVILAYAPTSKAEEAEVEWFTLETNRDHFVILRVHSSTAFRTVLLNMRATPFLLRDSCPQ